MTDLRTAAQQALEALSHFDDVDKIEAAIAALKAALAEPTLQTCNCRWDGEVQVQQCTLHEAHIDAIHEWAERAKTAEKKLAALAEPVATFDEIWDAIDWDKWRMEPIRELVRMIHSKTSPRAALAEPVQEPVAWYFEARHIDSAWSAAVSLKHPGPEGVYMRNVKPLYTAPPQRPAEPVQEPVQDVPTPKRGYTLAAEPPDPTGCDHCRHFAKVKCLVCGRGGHSAERSAAAAIRARGQA